MFFMGPLCKGPWNEWEREISPLLPSRWYHLVHRTTRAAQTRATRISSGESGLVASRFPGKKWNVKFIILLERGEQLLLDGGSFRPISMPRVDAIFDGVHQCLTVFAKRGSCSYLFFVLCALCFKSLGSNTASSFFSILEATPPSGDKTEQTVTKRQVFGG